MDGLVLGSGLLSPATVLADLAAIGSTVQCDRCILRLCGYGHHERRAYQSTSMEIRRYLTETCNVPNDDLLPEKVSCPSCLAILQIPDDPRPGHYVDTLRDTRRYSAYQITHFTVYVSLPALSTLRVRILQHHLHTRFGLKYNRTTPIKDVAKWIFGVIVTAAGDGIEFKIDADFRITIDLDLDGADEEITACLKPYMHLAMPRNMTPKRARQVNTTSGTFVDKCLDMMSAAELSAVPLFGPPPQPCTGNVSFHHQPILVTGKYIKNCRLLSQSPWFIDNKRLAEMSVQEMIVERVQPAFTCADYKFHASGREDCDVRMLGGGRYFILEFLDPHSIPTAERLLEIEMEINAVENDQVQVRELRLAPNYAAEFKALTEGSQEKTKSYRAVCWSSATLTPDMCRKIEQMGPIDIQQLTPIRVLHRRSLLSRPRRIHSISIELINSHFMLIDMVTQAGTYVKEFVHGDRGRTTPSIGSMLGCQADIIQLDVCDLHER